MSLTNVHVYIPTYTQHRASYEQLYLQAHALSQERPALQDRLEACLCTLENAQKEVLRQKAYDEKDIKTLDTEVKALKEQLREAEEECAKVMQHLKLSSHGR